MSSSHLLPPRPLRKGGITQLRPDLRLVPLAAKEF